ncbi:MAG: hypothetical protein EBZ48_05395 [Proteobacteria bacterium]|nr:hypothetical protein [Pseudomonadota bacterium]
MNTPILANPTGAAPSPSIQPPVAEQYQRDLQRLTGHLRELHTLGESLRRSPSPARICIGQLLELAALRGRLPDTVPVASPAGLGGICLGEESRVSELS